MCVCLVCLDFCCVVEEWLIEDFGVVVVRVDLCKVLLVVRLGWKGFVVVVGFCEDDWYGGFGVLY